VLWGVVDDVDKCWELSDAGFRRASKSMRLRLSTAKVLLTRCLKQQQDLVMFVIEQAGERSLI
jgi:hypothetical protein